MKKSFSILFSSILVLLFLISCADESNKNEVDDTKIAVQTGKVTFFNESSYMVTVHRDSFAGPVLIKLPPNSPAQTCDVRISDNYSVGSVFSVEYLVDVRSKIPDGYFYVSGEVWVNGIDPNLQMIFVVEANNPPYTKQIPNPTYLECSTAFINIHNISNTQFELLDVQKPFAQAGDGTIPVPAGKMGVYKIEASTEGRAHNTFNVRVVFEKYDIPAFSAKNGFI
jgi:hypothetical protein